MSDLLTIPLTTSEIQAIAAGNRKATPEEAAFLARHLLAEGAAYTLCFNERMQLLSEARHREERLRQLLRSVGNQMELMAYTSASLDRELSQFCALLAGEIQATLVNQPNRYDYSAKED